jgi:ribonuclease-3 family protein
MTDFSPLTLAYVGDAVFELLTRASVLERGETGVNALNQRAKEFVTAEAQRSFYFDVFDQLSPDEQMIMKRGRNAKPNAKSKNATVADYQHATGLEALFGYLYLTGKNERLREIFNMCVKTVESVKNETIKSEL